MTAEQEVIESGFEDQLAFPNSIPFGSSIADGCAHGLTKRELFAMTAMGHLAAAHVQGGDTFSRLVAEQAVEYADALLKALDK